MTGPTAPVYCKHVVAFIDHLGQRARLRRLDSLVNPYDAPDEVQAALKDGAGRVKLARDHFTKWFTALEAQPPTRDIHPLAHDIIGFSDSIAISAPVSGAIDAEMAASRLHVFLFSIAAMMLTCLANTTPLRAGIDVGDGLRGMFPREVYGPVTVSAYDLENKYAKYPRAAIGCGLMRYLDFLESEDPHARLAVQDCRALICEDQTDESPMLHVLSKVVVERLNMVPRDAYRWATQQQERFVSCGDDKLAAYYKRLVDYFRDNGY